MLAADPEHAALLLAERDFPPVQEQRGVGEQRLGRADVVPGSDECERRNAAPSTQEGQSDVPHETTFSGQRATE